MNRLLLVRALILMVSVLLVSTIFSILGCKPVEHADLDTQLNALVEAQRQGKAEAFAKEHRIDLIDANVKVMIQAESGRTEAAIKLINQYGIVDFVSQFTPGLISATIPITSLITLVEDKSIKFIELPAKFSPS